MLVTTDGVQTARAARECAFRMNSRAWPCAMSYSLPMIDYGEWGGPARAANRASAHKWQETPCLPLRGIGVGSPCVGCWAAATAKQANRRMHAVNGNIFSSEPRQALLLDGAEAGIGRNWVSRLGLPASWRMSGHARLGDHAFVRGAESEDGVAVRIANINAMVAAWRAANRGVAAGAQPLRQYPTSQADFVPSLLVTQALAPEAAVVPELAGRAIATVGAAVGRRGIAQALLEQQLTTDAKYSHVAVLGAGFGFMTGKWQQLRFTRHVRDHQVNDDDAKAWMFGAPRNNGQAANADFGGVAEGPYLGGRVVEVELDRAAQVAEQPGIVLCLHRELSERDRAALALALGGIDELLQCTADFPAPRAVYLLRGEGVAAHPLDVACNAYVADNAGAAWEQAYCVLRSWIPSGELADFELAFVLGQMMAWPAAVRRTQPMELFTECVTRFALPPAMGVLVKRPDLPQLGNVSLGVRCPARAFGAIVAWRRHLLAQAIICAATKGDGVQLDWMVTRAGAGQFNAQAMQLWQLHTGNGDVPLLPDGRLGNASGLLAGALRAGAGSAALKANLTVLVGEGASDRWAGVIIKALESRPRALSLEEVPGVVSLTDAIDTVWAGLCHFQRSATLTERALGIEVEGPGVDVGGLRHTEECRLSGLGTELHGADLPGCLASLQQCMRLQHISGVGMHPRLLAIPKEAGPAHVAQVRLFAEAALVCNQGAVTEQDLALDWGLYRREAPFSVVGESDLSVRAPKVAVYLVPAAGLVQAVVASPLQWGLELADEGGAAELARIARHFW